jgi:integrase
MQTNSTPASNRPTRLGRIPRASNGTAARRQRFRILPFHNASGTKSYRVQGMTRAKDYIRENFADETRAETRRLELESEFWGRQLSPQAAVQATQLSTAQVAIAESAFRMLDADEELLLAVRHWLDLGRPQAKEPSPLLDDAYRQFCAWLATTPTLRVISKGDMRRRVGMFVAGVPNAHVDRISPDMVLKWLNGRDASPVTKGNDRRAISRFFSWCMEAPRNWLAMNPANGQSVKIEAAADESEPVILSVDDCERLLRAAEAHKGGLLVPHVALLLFGGLRPSEAERLKPEQLNLGDAEIRLSASQTKTGQARTVGIVETLAVWLRVYADKPLVPPCLRKEFRAVRAAAGFAEWTPDVLRHTSVSNYFRKTGSYGLTASQHGNSESVIKKHYEGRTSSVESAKFYALRPTR